MPHVCNFLGYNFTMILKRLTGKSQRFKLESVQFSSSEDCLIASIASSYKLRNLSIFASTEGFADEVGFEHQSALPCCFCNRETNTLVLKVPVQECTFITIFDCVKNKLVFKTRVLLNKVDGTCKDEDWEYLRNTAIFCMEALEPIISRQKNKNLMVTGNFFCPNWTRKDDIRVVVVPTETQEGLFSTFSIGNMQGAEDAMIHFVSLSGRGNFCTIKFEVPDLGQVKNFVILVKGKVVCYMPHPSHISAGHLGRFAKNNAISWNNDEQYQKWAEEHALTEAEAVVQRNTKFNVEPKFSIVVPLYHTPKEYLDDLVESYEKQTYSKSELVLVNASPEDADLKANLKPLKKRDNIKIVKLEKNLGINLNTIAGAEVATGDYICFLDHDDFLSHDALYCFAKEINKHPETDVLFSDEDHVEDGKYTKPMFKTPVNRATLMCKNSCIHFLCIKRDLYLQNCFRSNKYDGSQDYHTVLKALDTCQRFAHIPKVLYHWRASETSTALSTDAKDYAESSSLSLLNDYFAKKHIPVTARLSPLQACYALDWKKPEHLKVGVVSSRGCGAFMHKLETLGYSAVHINSKSLKKHVQDKLYERTDCDLLVFAKSCVLFEDAGLGQMIRRAFWQNEILSAISVDNTGWIFDAGFEKNKQGEFLPRQAGRNIVHPGNLCCNLAPLNVDGVSENFLVMRKDLLSEVTSNVNGFSTNLGLTVVPDVQVVTRGKSLPVITATREESVCFNPELDAYSREFSLK